MRPLGNGTRDSWRDCGAPSQQRHALLNRVFQPPVVELSEESREVDGHRDGNLVDDDFSHDRIEPFDGRFVRDKYAAARRGASFSCSRRQVLLRVARLGGLLASSSGLAAVHDIGLAVPLVGSHFVNVKIARNLSERDAILARAP